MCTLYERISSLCKERGITGGKMCTDMHMSKSTLTDLKMGRQSGLSAAKAQKIASYLNVSVGYLLGEEELKEEKKEQPTKGELSEVKQALIDLVDGLSESEAAILLASLKSGLGR